MFVERLDEVLKEQNSNINQLAKKTGISQQTISSWKTGRSPSIDKIRIICENLNVSADYLLEIQPREPDKFILNMEERILLEHFRKIKDIGGREIILEMAKREASRGNIVPEEVPKEESFNLPKIG